jgi:hypothetical protein
MNNEALEFNSPEVLPVSTQQETTTPVSSQQSGPAKRSSTNKSFTVKSGQLVRELLIVFIGVFAAFLLNDYWNERKEQAKEKKLYQALYQDMKRFSRNGKAQEEGFLRRLQFWSDSTEKLVAKGEAILYPGRIYGDYWHMGVFDAMMKSGKLNDIDVDVFVTLANNHTLYMMFLDNIQYCNEFYESKIAPYAETGASEFYDPETGELKTMYKSYLYRQKEIVHLSKLLVDIADEHTEEWERKGLVDVIDISGMYRYGDSDE